MTERDQVEKLADREFDFLTREFGFSRGAIRRVAVMTVVDYLSTEIGIEIEIDWREQDVLVLVVRLESGRLPDGYYVSGGRVCRIHLERVLRERGWMSADQLSRIKALSGAKPRRKADVVTLLKAKILEYRSLVRESVERVLSSASQLFPPNGPEGCPGPGVR